jgi:hypothetical protein
MRVSVAGDWMGIQNTLMVVCLFDVEGGVGSHSSAVSLLQYSFETSKLLYTGWN